MFSIVYSFFKNRIKEISHISKKEVGLEKIYSEFQNIFEINYISIIHIEIYYDERIDYDFHMVFFA